MTASKIAKLFISWWMTAVLVLSLGAAYLAFTFGKSPYGQWTGFVLRTPFGLTLYIGLTLNLLAAGAQVVYHGLRGRRFSVDKVRMMDVFTEVPGADADALLKSAEWMKKKGFPGRIQGNCVLAVRGRFSFLPGTIMRLGFVILLISLLFSIFFRRTETLVVHEGETVNSSHGALTLASVTSALPEDFLQVGDESNFQLEHPAARIVSSGTACTITPGLPTRLHDRDYRLVHLGYAQPFMLQSAGRAFERTIDLDILPPGKSSIVTLPSSNIFLTVSLEPEKTISKGILKGKQFNLAAPFYRIVLQNGGGNSKPRVLTLRPGDSRTTGGIHLSLGKSSLFVRIQIVSDPWLRWLYGGGLLSLFGMILMLSRFFWYKKEMAAAQDGTTLTIGYREEFFKKWGIQRFHQWEDELLRLF